MADDDRGRVRVGVGSAGTRIGLSATWTPSAERMAAYVGGLFVFVAISFSVVGSLLDSGDVGVGFPIWAAFSLLGCIFGVGGAAILVIHFTGSARTATGERRRSAEADAVLGGVVGGLMFGLPAMLGLPIALALVTFGVVEPSAPLLWSLGGFFLLGALVTLATLALYRLNRRPA